MNSKPIRSTPMAYVVFNQAPKYVKNPTIPPDVRNATTIPANLSRFLKCSMNPPNCQPDEAMITRGGSRTSAIANINPAPADRHATTQCHPSRDAANAPAGTPMKKATKEPIDKMPIARPPSSDG